MAFRVLSVMACSLSLSLSLALSLALLLVASPVWAGELGERLNDYPTEARADYVFGCMAVNGQGREVLGKCACSIDVIAEILPYEAYVKAETVLAMQQGSGERMSMFKTMAFATDAVKDLRRAQAEAEIRCFE